VKGRDVVFLMMAIFAVGYFGTQRLFWDIYRSGIRGSDLSSYYTAGTLVREGDAARLYDISPSDSILGDATEGPWAEAGARAGVTRQHYYIYPPAFALLFAPLSLLAFGTALIAVTCLFEFLPLIWALAIGQTSLIVLALLTGTLLAWRRGADNTAGVLLGLAVALKLTPALIAVFFLWRGRRRIAWVSAAVFALIQILSVAVLGWEVHRQFFLEVVPGMSGGTTYFLNQSLGAFFNRLLTGSDVRQVDLVDSAAARLLAGLLFLILTAISAPRLRRAAAGVPLGDELQFGCVLLLSLMASPISWTHHYLLALPALYAVMGNLGRRKRPALARARVAGLALLLIARKPHPDLFLEGILRIFNSGALAGAFLLWLLTVTALKSARQGVEEVAG
jgi:hypothetical protein